MLSFSEINKLNTIINYVTSSKSSTDIKLSFSQNSHIVVTVTEDGMMDIDMNWFIKLTTAHQRLLILPIDDVKIYNILVPLAFQI